VRANTQINTQPPSLPSSLTTPEYGRNITPLLRTVKSQRRLITNQAKAENNPAQLGIIKSLNAEQTINTFPDLFQAANGPSPQLSSRQNCRLVVIWMGWIRLVPFCCISPLLQALYIRPRPTTLRQLYSIILIVNEAFALRRLYLIPSLASP